MAHDTDIIEITVAVTEANRYVVALPKIGTKGVIIGTYAIECTAGSLNGRLLVMDRDPGTWASDPNPASRFDVYAETDDLALLPGVTAKEPFTQKPTIMRAAAGAYVVIEDPSGVGLAAFTGRIRIGFSELPE